MPVFIFLIRRSFASLGLTYGRALREALLPVILAALPLMAWAGFVMATEQAKSLASLIACIAVFSLLWVLGLYILGISKHERRLIGNKLGFV
jgi:hypothetical protein